MVRIKLSSVLISLIVLFWALSAGAPAQNSTLRGTVKDMAGIPLIKFRQEIRRVYHFKIYLSK